MRSIQLITSGRKTLRWLLPYVLFAGLAYLATPFLPRVVEHVVSGLPELLASAIMPMMESLGETHFVMVVLTVGAGVAAVVKGIITLLRMIGLMPTGLRGTTLVSAGLLFAVIGLHLYRPQPLLLFVGVGGAMVVWKIGKQSVVLSAETGRTSTTARVELTHLLATFLFASLSVLVARTALFIATSIQFRLDAAGWMVFVLASIGLVLVTANFRNQ